MTASLNVSSSPKIISIMSSAKKEDVVGILVSLRQSVSPDVSKNANQFPTHINRQLPRLSWLQRKRFGLGIPFHIVNVGSSFLFEPTDSEGIAQNMSRALPDIRELKLYFPRVQIWNGNNLSRVTKTTSWHLIPFFKRDFPDDKFRPERGYQGLVHQIGLPSNGSQRFPKKPYLQGAYHYQQSAECPISPICQVSPCDYCHGRKFTDDYGILRILFLFSAIPIGGWGLIRVRSGNRWSGWTFVVLVSALDAGACASGMIGRLPWEWKPWLADDQGHSENGQRFQHSLENVSPCWRWGYAG